MSWVLREALGAIACSLASWGGGRLMFETSAIAPNYREIIGNLLLEQTEWTRGSLAGSYAR